MKFFRMVSLVLISSVAFSSLTLASSAAPAKLAGTKCSKVWQTKVLNERRYTCVRTAGKLVWNKGVALKPKPEVTAKPVPASAPTAPDQPITFDNLDTNWVRKMAYAEIKKGVLSAKSFSPNITYVIGPSLSKERVDSERAGLNRASDFFSDIYRPSQVYIGYFTEQDVDWVDEAFCSQARFCPSGNHPKVSSTIKTSLPNCNFAQATKNSDGLPFFDQCLGTGSTAIKNKQTGPHEYFHWVQAEYSDWNTIPNWFIEGSADYFGDALGSWDGSDLPAAMDQMQFVSSYNWLGQDLCPLAQPTIEKVVNCFKYTYRKSGPPAPGSKWMLAHVSYYMGSQATEAMIAVKGLDAFFNFLKDLKNGEFDSIFAKHYGLTVDEFYPKVAKYVLDMHSQRR